MERWITKKRQRIIFIDSPRPNAYALDEAYTGCLLKLIADNRSLFVDRGEGEEWKEEGGGERTRSQNTFLFLLLLLLFLLSLLSLSRNSIDYARFLFAQLDI